MADMVLGIGSRVKHKEFGDGVIINVKSNTYLITFMQHGTKEISHNYALDVIDAEDVPDDIISLSDIERSLTNIIRKFSDIQETVPLGQKWIGGKMILQPGDRNQKPKEIAIDAFFHKIVMVRDRLRVLEQRVNASALNDEEKVNIQQYITRCYGSLTSFNVLFKNAGDQFVGEKGAGD